MKLKEMMWGLVAMVIIVSYLFSFRKDFKTQYEIPTRFIGTWKVVEKYPPMDGVTSISMKGKSLSIDDVRHGESNSLEFAVNRVSVGNGRMVLFYGEKTRKMEIVFGQKQLITAYEIIKTGVNDEESRIEIGDFTQASSQ